MIWAFCECADGKATGHSVELVGKAAELAAARGTSAGAVLYGSGLEREAEHLAAAGADVLYVIEGDPACPDDGAVARGLVQAVQLHRPEAVIVPATVRGRSIAPQAAALLGTGLTANCTCLHIGEGGLLVQTRPAFGSSLMARILCATARPQMAGVRPGAFPVPALDWSRKARVVSVPHSETRRLELVRSEGLDTGGGSLTDATVILAGGMGLESPQGFASLEKLAALTGASPGASRAAVHAGYAPYSRQVGQTGVTVRPRLYLAFGISGAVQHCAGMAGAECIVAVNSDPKAPIFRIADYGLVADAGSALEALLREFVPP